MKDKPSNQQNTDLKIELTVDESGLEKEEDKGNDLEGRPSFDPTKIDIITKNISIDALLTRLKYGELDLSPDFQRNPNLWNFVRKTSLIESLLLRIPIPSMYVSEDKQGNYAVVDGLQRMSSIAHFVNVKLLNKALKTDDKPLHLHEKGLRTFQEYKGYTFDELDRPLQRRIIETELTVHVIRSGTPGIVKFNIFSRINEGGLPLKAQEIRNAIYPSIWRKKIKELAESEEFFKATEGKIKAKRMEDMELILRAVALHYQDMPRPSDQNLEDFLNLFVEKECQHWEDNQWDEVQKNIKRALIIAPLILGDYVFRKYYRQKDKRKPINRGLFEAQVSTLSCYNYKQLEHLFHNKREVEKKFIELSDNDDFKKIYLTNDSDRSSYELDIMLAEDDFILEEKDSLPKNEKIIKEILLRRNFNKGLTQATSKGLASNQRIEAMKYIFNHVLESFEEEKND